MAVIKPKLEIEIDPTHPVPEICEVISAVTSCLPAKDEVAVLRGVIEALGRRLNDLKKGDDANAEQLLQPNASE